MRIPSTVTFHEKWRLALTLVRRTRASGLTVTGVAADAEYGDNSTVRQTLHRLRLPLVGTLQDPQPVRPCGEPRAWPTVLGGGLAAPGLASQRPLCAALPLLASLVATDEVGPYQTIR